MDFSRVRSSRRFGGELGVKGLLRIVVDQSVYRAGDLVTGGVLVTVREPIRTDTLSCSIIGEEIAQWMQSGDHHSQYHEFLNQEIVTKVLPDPFMPGDYMFPFEYQLEDDLPGVLDADTLFGTVESLHASIKYTIKARIRIEGRFVSDLEAQFDLMVRAKEVAPTRCSAVERTISKKIRSFNLLHRGTCHLAGAMPKNVFSVGESARVDCFVNNHTSSVGVQQVKCCLYQDVTLKLSSGESRQCTRLVSQVKCPGPQSGQLLERPMILPIGGKVQHPTTVGYFLSCKYRITIECDLRWRHGLSVDFPVIVVANDKRRNHVSTPTAPIPMMRSSSVVHNGDSMSRAPTVNLRRRRSSVRRPSVVVRPGRRSSLGLLSPSQDLPSMMYPHSERSYQESVTSEA